MASVYQPETNALEFDEMVKLAKKMLNDLPDSSLGIALELLDLGIKGCKNDAHSCPMSVYFKQRGADVSVVDTHVIVWPNDCCNKQHRLEIKSNFTEFVHDFDKGKYPDLDLYPEEAPYAGT